MRVTTEASVYDIDLVAMTLTRHAGADASDLRKDGETVPLIEVVSCEVGHRGVFLVDVRGDGIATARYTTLITSIEGDR